MKPKKEGSKGPLSWSLSLEPEDDTSSFAEDIDGRLTIDVMNENISHYPITFYISKNCDFLTMPTAERKIESGSDFPISFTITTHPGDDSDQITVSNDTPELSDVKIKIPSSDILNVYAAILSEEDTEVIAADVADYYEGELQTTNLRNNADNLTTFEQYAQILNFLYTFGSYRSINQARSLKKRLLGRYSVYHASSYDEFENKVKFYSSQSGLDNISIDDIFYEVVLDMWNLDPWEDAEELPNIQEVNQIVSQFGTKPLSENIASEHMAHFHIGYYLRGQYTSIKRLLEPVGGQLSLTHSTDHPYHEIYLTLGEGLYQDNVEPDKEDIVHFLYSTASGLENSQMNKTCAAMYHQSSVLFEKWRISDWESWGTEARIRAHIQRGYDYKVTQPTEAFKHFSDATRIYHDNRNVLQSPPKDKFLHAAIQASKAIHRQLQQDGDIETAAENIEAIAARITEEVSEFDEYGNVEEVRGYKFDILARKAVKEGDFGQAQAYISRAIDNFGQADRDEGVLNLEDVELQAIAIEGLIAESKGEFNTAADCYLNAKDEATTDKDRKLYEIWSELASAKGLLLAGQFENARQSIEDIEEPLEDVLLYDLGKLRLLIGLLEDYEDGKHSNAQEIFNQAQEVNKEVIPQKGVIQHNINYSIGYTLLLTRQRQKQLGNDTGRDERFIRSLEDAVTPAGLDEDIESQSDGGTRGTRPEASRSKETEIDNETSESHVASADRDYTEVSRAQRDLSFFYDVKEAYKDRCAVCGVQRYTPDGRPEVESAHIWPVGEGGPDTADNGLALCQLHHWAFDNGWLAVADDYTIIVRDEPEVNGYEDFAQLHGDDLFLPDDEDDYPRPEYLRKHREKHQFELN